MLSTQRQLHRRESAQGKTVCSATLSYNLRSTAWDFSLLSRFTQLLNKFLFKLQIVITETLHEYRIITV